MVGCLFFLEILLEKRRAVGPTQLLGPGDERAIARHLIVLDRLCGRHESGVEHAGVVNLASDLVGFLENAVDRRAVHALGFNAMPT